MNAIIEYFVNNFTANPIGFAISVATLILEIALYQFKRMKTIVITQCVTNFLVVLTYALGDGLSGAAVCSVATVQTFLIYVLYQKNDREISKAFTGIFIAAYLVCSAFTFAGLIDIIPASAAVLFALGVVQSKAWKYRIIFFANCLLWIIYDIIIAAPVPMLITHTMGVVSVVIGIIRLDLKEWTKKKS